MEEPIRHKRKSKHTEPVPHAEEQAVDAEQVSAKPESKPPLMLTQDELHKMRLYEAEARASNAEAETCRLRKRFYLALLDPKGTVEAEEKKQAAHLEKARGWAKKHEIVIAHISMRLGVDLKDCGFDPETGVVVPDPSAKGAKGSSA